tara:strand:+ start:2485 stop:2874 length:390 start_codon:yes stop_codon:yes gene_type:complete
MKEKVIPYKSGLKELARQLRNKSTLGEVLLWKKLRAKQFEGYDFHIQKPLLSFIVDFYCSKLNLVMEIDGNSHDRSVVASKDADKESALNEYGLTVLRFTEAPVRFEMEDVLQKLEMYVKWHEEKNARL